MYFLVKYSSSEISPLTYLSFSTSNRCSFVLLFLFLWNSIITKDTTNIVIPSPISIPHGPHAPIPSPEKHLPIPYALFLNIITIYLLFLFIFLIQTSFFYKSLHQFHHLQIVPSIAFHTHLPFE